MIEYLLINLAFLALFALIGFKASRDEDRDMLKKLSDQKKEKTADRMTSGTSICGHTGGNDYQEKLFQTGDTLLNRCHHTGKTPGKKPS